MSDDLSNAFARADEFFAEVTALAELDENGFVSNGLLPVLRDLAYKAGTAKTAGLEISDAYLGRVNRLKDLCVQVGRINLEKEQPLYEAIQEAFPSFEIPIYEG